MTKNPAEIAGTRYKNEKLMSRVQKTDGTSRCFAQIENIKRQSLIYRRIKKLAGLPYSVSDFLSMDKVTKFQGQQMSAPALHEFVPLARPKMIKD